MDTGKLIELVCDNLMVAESIVAYAKESKNKIMIIKAEESEVVARNIYDFLLENSADLFS